MNMPTAQLSSIQSLALQMASQMSMADAALLVNTQGYDLQTYEQVPGLPLTTSSLHTAREATVQADTVMADVVAELVGRDAAESPRQQLASVVLAQAVHLAQAGHWQGPISPSRFAELLAGSLESVLAPHVPARFNEATTTPETHHGSVTTSSHVSEGTPAALTTGAHSSATTHVDGNDSSPAVPHDPKAPISADEAPQNSPSSPGNPVGNQAHRRQISSSPLGRGILITTLDRYRKGLYFKELFKGSSVANIPTLPAADTELSSIPYRDDRATRRDDGAIVLGGSALVGRAGEIEDDPIWVIPAGPIQSPAEIIQMATFRLAAVALQGPTHEAGLQGVTGTQSTSTQASVLPFPEIRTQGSVEIPAEIPTDIPPISSRYGRTPSRTAVNHWNLVSGLQNEIRTGILDVPQHAPMDGRTSNDFAHGISVQPDYSHPDQSSQLSPQDEELKAHVTKVLDQAGYLNWHQADDGSESAVIRPLRNVTDGLLLLKLLTGLTPADHDLFDLLEKMETRWNLSLGEWCDGRKNLNATLRTYALWESREGSKEASLIHPAGGRANIVIQVNDLFQQLSTEEIFEFLRIDSETLARMSQARTAEELKDALPSTSVLARLLVETEYMSTFLNHPNAWLDRLFGDRGPEYRQSHTERLKKLNQMTEDAVIRCLRNLLSLAHGATVRTSASA